MMDVLLKAFLNRIYRDFFVVGPKREIYIDNWFSWRSVPQWPGRPGFDPISNHSKDSKNET